jgi:hypothetical protein
MKNAKTTIKSLLYVTLVLGISAGFTSCKKEGCTDEKAKNYDSKAKKDNGSCEYDKTTTTPVAKGEVEKTGEIIANETWTSNNIYFLKGRVVVKSGVTLTIEPGTIIKGKEGLESNASALVITRGAKIMAVGTAEKPIIFTSELDNITYDQLAGTSLKRTDNEKWGGVVILGYAPISAKDGNTEANIEGLPEEAGIGKFGGSNSGDNSGEIAYVSIRHGGVTIGEGNELNGLTLGGVGSGTKISNIEIYATLDDGIECFGGTVDVSNALVYFQGDDGLDLDMNYAGTIQSFAVIHGDGIATDEGFEIDGPEGSTYTSGLFTIKNGYVKALGAEGTPGDFKDKAQGTVTNVTFDYASATKKDIKLRAKFNGDCSNATDAYKNWIDNKLVFTNCKFAGATAYDAAATPVCTSELTVAKSDLADNLKGTGTGHTFDYKGSFGWTCAGQRGEL